MNYLCYFFGMMRQKYSPSGEVDAYLKRNGLRHTDLAKTLGVSPALVSHWITGRTRITAENAVLIEVATNGEISRQSIRPDLWPTQ